MLISPWQTHVVHTLLCSNLIGWSIGTWGEKSLTFDVDCGGSLISTDEKTVDDDGTGAVGTLRALSSPAPAKSIKVLSTEPNPVNIKHKTSIQ